MNVIAPVFAPGAQTSPRVEEALRRLWLGEVPRSRRVPTSKPGTRYQLPETLERQERVKRMVKRNMTAPEMAKALGVSPGSIWYDLKYLGLEPRKVRYCHRTRSRHAQNRREQIVEMMKSGEVTTRQISDIFGVSMQTARKDMRFIRGGKP